MIFRIGQRLTRSNDNALACMDAQRVKVFHIADGDTVVVTVAHHLVFYLFPSLQTLFHQHLW